MKKSFKTMWILAILLFVFWNLFPFFFGRNSTELVQYGTMENAFRVTGILFKDEIVVSGAEDGVLQPTIADGERVAKGARIGAMLSNDTDEGALHEYLRIQDRIERLTVGSSATLYVDTVRTDGQITELSNSIIRAAESGNMEKLARLKEELLLAKDEKNAAEGNRETLIAALEARQKDLRGKIGNSVREIYSPEAGTLQMQCDGLEEKMSLAEADGLTIGELKELTEAGDSHPGCKIVYNDRWKMACAIEEELAQSLKTGQVVSLRFLDQGGETGKATIAEVSEPENGECVLILTGTKAPHGFIQCRKVMLEVILDRFEGFRIPKKALTEENGETGVYVQTITKRAFKKVEVSYMDGAYAIIREGENTELRLYDTVLY